MICLTFTGTLPGWLTLDGNTISVIPGSFRGNTQAEADAAAQAALDAFIAEAIDSGDLVCAGGCLSQPEFETTRQDFTITSASSSTNRPGSYNKLVNFAGVAGQTLNIWMNATAFSTAIYLQAPDNSVLANDLFSGYAYPGITTAALSYTLPVTGTYTIDCTTLDPGVTGNFTLVLSSNPLRKHTFGTNDNNFMRDVVYVEPFGKVFCFNQIGNLTEDANIYVLDACDVTTLATLYVPGSDPPSTFQSPLGAVYNTVNGMIYFISSDRGLYTLNPDTYDMTLVFADACNRDSNGVGIAYDAATNRIFIGLNGNEFPNESGVRVINCADNTEAAVVSVGDVNWLDCAANGYCYVVVGTGVVKINTTTLIPSATALVADSGRIRAVNEKGLLFVRSNGIEVSVVDYATDTVVDTIYGSVEGFKDAVWSEFAQRILVTDFGITGIDFATGVSYYEPDTQVVDNFAAVTGAEGIAFSSDTNCCFVASREPAIVSKLI